MSDKPTRAELINNFGEVKKELENDAERIEHYRERLRNGDDIQDILEDFMEDDSFFID